MKTMPCRVCSAPVELLEDLVVRTVLCFDCAREIEGKEKIQRHEAALDAQWELICPPMFKNTVEDLLPVPDQSRKALDWERRPDGRGLNLWGYPNTGKTRTLFLILRREHRAGVSIKVYSSGEFERDLEKRNFKRAPLVEYLCRVELLAFDDFDKMNLTREMEKVLFAIVDARMNKKLPVLFTHNSTADQIEYRFRFGESLVRRLRDFCQAIHFKRY